jgi:hypothetical protein
MIVKADVRYGVRAVGKPRKHAKKQAKRTRRGSDRARKNCSPAAALRGMEARAKPAGFFFGLYIRVGRQ